MCTCGRKKLPFAGYSVVKDLEASSCQRSAASHLERRLRDELLSKTFLAQTFGPPSPLRGYGETTFAWLANPPPRFALRWTSRLGLPTEARSGDQRQRAKVGGEYRARTGDLLVANQALSQLS
jgi:hypothetical protein